HRRSPSHGLPRGGRGFHGGDRAEGGARHCPGARGCRLAGAIERRRDRGSRSASGKKGDRGGGGNAAARSGGRDTRMTQELTAHQLLGPTLIELVDTARAASARVEESFRGQKGASGATGALDPEAVHDFRVALRRLRTLLRVARKVYGKKHM